MNRIFLLFPKLVVIFCLAFTGCQADKTNSTPNVVFILADDMGYGDPGCYNPASRIPTPNLDLMAREGIRFTDAHTASSVCTPSRYGLLTGRYCWRTRLKRSVLWPYDYTLIEKDRQTLPKMFKENGYRTACIGKWHLGWEWGTTEEMEKPWAFNALVDGSKVDLNKPINGGPMEAGFDYYFGVDVPNFPPYCFIENNRLVGQTPVQMKPDTVFGWKGRMQEGWKLENILPGLEQKAIAYIGERKDDDKPFFLYFPLTAPHTPIAPAAEYAGRSNAGDYGDFVVQCDAIVGNVIKALKEAGKYENTILVFSSDNGSPGRAGDQFIRNNEWAQTGAVKRLFNHNPSEPWRGMKADSWEAGHRVPCLVVWPGKVKGETVNNEMICLTDFYATFANLLGKQLNTNEAEDSFDFLSLLTDGAPSKRDHLVHHSGNGVFGVRKGGWKYITRLGSGGFSHPGSQKPVPGGPKGQLYFLEKDPGESENLYLQKDSVIMAMEQFLESIKESGRTR